MHTRKKKKIQNASRNNHTGVVHSKLMTRVINVAYKYNMKLDDIKLFKVVFSLSLCQPIKKTALSWFYFTTYVHFICFYCCALNCLARNLFNAKYFPH